MPLVAGLVWRVYRLGERRLGPLEARHFVARGLAGGVKGLFSLPGFIRGARVFGRGARSTVFKASDNWRPRGWEGLAAPRWLGRLVGFSRLAWLSERLFSRPRAIGGRLSIRAGQSPTKVSAAVLAVPWIWAVMMPSPSRRLGVGLEMSSSGIR